MTFLDIVSFPGSSVGNFVGGDVVTLVVLAFPAGVISLIVAIVLKIS